MSSTPLEFSTPQRKQLLLHCLLQLSKGSSFPVRRPAFPAVLGIPEMVRDQPGYLCTLGLSMAHLL